MTSGRVLALTIIGVTILFGIGLWYALTRAYYVELDDIAVALQRPDGTTFGVEVAQASGIDASSSPLRYRVCFQLPEAEIADLLDDAMAYDDPVPLTAPGWFDCYDAEAIGEALEAGDATAVLAQRNITRGVDRVVALFPDGRGYVWHQLNGTLE